MRFNHVILDCDILVYRCGFAIQSADDNGNIVAEPVHHAYYNVNSIVRKCLELSGFDDNSRLHGYLTIGGKDNFRFDIYKYYKENRVKCLDNCGNPHPYECKELGHNVSGSRPVYYAEIREFILRKWAAEMVYGQEADDAMSIKQYELNNSQFSPETFESIIWTLDKDLNNTPGWHGNIVSGEIFYVTPLEALQNFYLQILTGDVSDGIPRIKKGWRKKETEAAIKKATTEKEILAIVHDVVYNLLYKEDTLESVFKIEQEITWRGQLVHMRTRPDEFWSMPNV
jgi:hypothetical protein